MSTFIAESEKSDVDDQSASSPNAKAAAATSTSDAIIGSAELNGGLVVDDDNYDTETAAADSAIPEKTFFGTMSSFFSNLKPAPMIRKRTSWNRVFGTAIKILRSVAKTIPRDIQSIRLLTDNGIPTWILPSDLNVTSCKSILPPGEWFYPKSKVNDTKAATAQATSTSTSTSTVTIAATAATATATIAATIAANNGSKTDAPSFDTKMKFILYFHGGAFCCCSSATHRGLLYRMSSKTGASILVRLIRTLYTGCFIIYIYIICIVKMTLAADKYHVYIHL